MDELARLVMTWGVGTLLMTALILGFFPVFVVNVLARVYPKGHPRRTELVAELVTVPRRERLIWVSEQLATVLFEGLPARIAVIIKKRRHARFVRRWVKPYRRGSVAATKWLRRVGDMETAEVVRINEDRSITLLHVKEHQRPDLHGSNRPAK